MISALLLAGALVAWPGGMARERLRHLDGPLVARLPIAGAVAGRVPLSVLVPVVAGVAGLLLAGVLHAFAAALLAAVVVDLRRRAGLRARRVERLGSWERALDDASSALRAGAGPEESLRRAAVAAGPGDPEVAALLTAASSHARLGGDVAAALFSAAAGPGVGAPRGHGGSAGDRVAGELAGAWLLATRHGVLLAEVVDGLREDVAARRERAVRVDAALAGPRATAVILTALPAFGVLLGSGFGADPLGVLVGGPVGGVLCLIGAAFLAAGLLWTDRIVDGASR